MPTKGLNKIKLFNTTAWIMNTSQGASSRCEVTDGSQMPEELHLSLRMDSAVVCQGYSKHPASTFICLYKQDGVWMLKGGETTGKDRRRE